MRKKMIPFGKVSPRPWREWLLELLKTWAWSLTRGFLRQEMSSKESRPPSSTTRLRLNKLPTKSTRALKQSRMTLTQSRITWMPSNKTSNLSRRRLKTSRISWEKKHRAILTGLPRWFKSRLIEKRKTGKRDKRRSKGESKKKIGDSKKKIWRNNRER